MKHQILLFTVEDLPNLIGLGKLQVIGRVCEDDIQTGDTFNEICKLERPDDNAPSVATSILPANFTVLTLEAYANTFDRLSHGMTGRLTLLASNKDIETLIGSVKSTKDVICIRGKGAEPESTDSGAVPGAAVGAVLPYLIPPSNAASRKHESLITVVQYAILIALAILFVLVFYLAEGAKGRR